jgi:hypothetical protein
MASEMIPLTASEIPFHGDTLEALKTPDGTVGLPHFDCRDSLKDLE